MNRTWRHDIIEIWNLAISSQFLGSVAFIIGHGQIPLHTGANRYIKIELGIRHSIARYNKDSFLTLTLGF